MSQTRRIKPLRYRSIWLSDVHLGHRGCKAEFLLDFLRSTESDHLYLLGDVVDVWAMKRGKVYWPQAHNDLIRTVLGKAKRGTRVIYIPGNHDEVLRDYAGMRFGNVEVHEDYEHTTADGRRLLLMHGDELDGVIRCGRLTSFLGDHAYDLLLYMNRWVERARRWFGAPYWSLSAYLKRKVESTVKVIARFERAAAHEARRRGMDGVVCGHIHHAEIAHIDGMLYCNDGDWLENCTVMVEHRDGSLEILHWSDTVNSVKRRSASAETADDDRASKAA